MHRSRICCDICAQPRRVSPDFTSSSGKQVGNKWNISVHVAKTRRRRIHPPCSPEVASRRNSNATRERWLSNQSAGVVEAVYSNVGKRCSAIAVFFSHTITRRDCGGRSTDKARRRRVCASIHPSYTHGLRPDALGRTASPRLATFEWISAVSPSER